MSDSDGVRAEIVATALEDLASRVARDAYDAPSLDDGLLRRIASASVKLFARCCERAGYEIVPVDGSVSTTEAVRLSVALAKSQHLSPFDLSLWFGHGGGSDGS